MPFSLARGVSIQWECGQVGGGVEGGDVRDQQWGSLCHFSGDSVPHSLGGGHRYQAILPFWPVSSPPSFLFTLDPGSPVAGIPQSPLLLPLPYPFPTPLLSLVPTVFLLGPEFLRSSYSLPASALCLVSQAVRMREGFEERGKAANTSSETIYACKCLCGKLSLILEGHEGGV